MASLIYRSRAGYELAMFMLYGRHYSARYRAIANLIPYGAEVLELCCGPGILYERYLRYKDVAYRGWISAKSSSAILPGAVSLPNNGTYAASARCRLPST